MITDQDSSDQQRFLFQSDLNRFWEVVANDDPTARLSALENLDDLLLVEAVRYGVFNKQEMIGPLAQFYRDPIMQMSEDRRFAVYRHVAGFVEHTSSVSTNSFLPFITEDNSRRIVSSAVIDYVSLGPISNDDPMSRVRDIVGMIESNMLQNEGAAFGALLHIGDKRVCDLLIPLRDSLDHDAMNNAVHSGTGFIHSATVDFYLDWLEGMEGIDQDGAFGIVASGLGLLKRKSRIDQVSTGNRPFPVRNVSPEQWQALQRPIPLAKYVQRVSRRMHALERAEPPPRVMPHVLTAWGLKPLTDPAEAAVLDDRAATTTAGFESEIIPGGRIAEVKGEWWDGEGSIYLTWGILNPNGPTLYVLGSREFDGKYRTFMRWLHMFGGCTAYAAETVDEITYQGIYDDANSIHEHLVENDEPGLFHVIPSFLIANGGDETLATIAKHLLAGGTAAKEDWGQSMAYTRQFGSDFFTRSATEIRATYESLLAETRAKGEEPPSVKFIEHRFGHLPDFQNAKIPSWTETPMTPELLEEWWQVISPRDFQVNALTTLRIMWEGAPKMLPDDARANVVPWEAVIRFLEGYGLRLPND